MMLRIALFMVMLVVIAGFGAVAWISIRPSPSTIETTLDVAPPVTVTVLTASRTLRPGALLKPDDLATSVIAQSTIPEGARIDTPAARADLLGAMLRRTVLAGEVLLPVHIMRTGDRGFLAAVLGPGLRAATVGVDAVTGTAGLIWPGDHVDLILTATIDDPTTPLGHRVAGETVLHNIRVIAIDQELMQGASAPATGSTLATPQTRTVTLEVTPENAERVAVATRLGHLSLSVISADTPDLQVKPTAGIAVVASDAAPITWGGDVSAALRTGPKSISANMMLRLYEGNAEGKEFHFQ